MGSTEWDDIAAWWVDAVREDPANSHDQLALLIELAGDLPPDALLLDAGCGEGQGMRAVDGLVIGTDVSMSLLRRARRTGPVVAARLPDLAWARSGVFDACLCVGVLELVGDHHRLLGELHRVTRPGGRLVVVMNHPVMTTPHAEPLADPTGEVLWRWGAHLRPGTVEQDLGDHTVVLHHRPLGELLTSAAAAGWRLELMLERGPSAATLERHPDYRGQEQIPTLLGLRWASAA